MNDFPTKQYQNSRNIVFWKLLLIAKIEEPSPPFSLQIQTMQEDYCWRLLMQCSGLKNAVDPYRGWNF